MIRRAAGAESAGDLALAWEEEAGTIAGLARVHDLGFRAHLSELIVASSARGQGVRRRQGMKIA